LFYLPLLSSQSALEHYAQGLGIDTADALEGLAQAISISSGWPRGLEVYLKVRRNPSPLLGVFVLGSPDLVALTWLDRQKIALTKTCGRLLYVNETETLRLLSALARRLADLHGHEALKKAQFVAIPQGGFKVLRMLASILDLRSAQLMTAPSSAEELLIVVDDCAISGLRFKQFLDTCPHPRITFAHLYSHPALRAAILEREPRVLDCVSAADLRETPQEVPPEQEQRRRERIEHGECYWIGSTEALCFPWNEPDRLFWNPATGRMEKAWRIVPPALCSKNRPVPGTVPVPIQIQPEGKGPLRPSQRAVFGELDGTLVLCDLEAGQCFSLEGVAADLWRALLVHGHPEAVASVLQAEYDVPGEVFREDTRNFFEDLEARGLIEWTEPA
jgi:hypothetical protein